MAGRFVQGYYVLKHPEKYIGDPNKVRYMSSWEYSVHRFLDNNPNVLRWASEEIAIKYIKPTDGKVHKYYPDVFVCYKTNTGDIKWELIEIKPKSQTQRPRANHKHKLYEQITYAVNLSKWKAAQAWCQHKTIEMGVPVSFRIITEKQIFA